MAHSQQLRDWQPVDMLEGDPDECLLARTRWLEMQPFKNTPAAGGEGSFRLRLEGKPVPPLPGVDKRLNAILMRCLQFRREQRYPDFAALLTDLEALPASVLAP